MQDLERIEIIRGPGATIFGANAVNGVININTKSAEDTQGLLLNSKIGTDLEFETALRYGGQLGENLHYRIFGKFSQWDGLENSVVGQEGDDWNLASGGFRADYNAGDNGNITFQGNFYNSEELGAASVGVTDSAPGSTLFTGDEEVNSWNFLSKYTKKINEQHQLEVQAYYDNYTRNALLGEFTVETFDIDARHTYRGENHTIVWGVGYRNYELDATNSLSLEFNPSQENYDMLSGFVQDTFNLGSEKFTATIGSKFEYNDFTGFEIQPSGRLTYSHSDRTAFWGGVSRAVRTPSIFEHRGVIRASNVSGTPAGPYAGFQGNPNLDSETLMAYELGFRSQMTDKFRLDVAAYIHEYDDLITITTGLLPGPTTTNNGGAGTTWGVEALANWDVADNWTLIGSFTYFGEDFDVVSNEDDFPEHSFNIQSRLDFGEDWELNAIGYYVDDPDATGSAEDYFRLDVGVTWRPRENMEIAVWGMNLTNDDTVEGTNTLDTTVYTVEPSVYASLSFKF